MEQIMVLLSWNCMWQNMLNHLCFTNYDNDRLQLFVDQQQSFSEKIFSKNFLIFTQIGYEFQTIYSSQSN